MKKRSDSFGQTKRSFMDNVIQAVRINKIKKLIPLGSRMLDLGCGYNAELIVELRREHISSGEGVDLSVNPKLNLIQGKVDSKLPFPDKSFDVVTALAIIEHVDHPEVMLSEILRVLKPNGTVFITTPSLSGKLPLEIMAKLGIISAEEIADHKRYYTRKSLLEAMKSAGLRSVKVTHFGIMYLNLFGAAKR